MVNDRMLSRYLDDLPAIYRQEAADGDPYFLGRFLLAFEHMLTGLGDRDRPGLEEILDGIIVGHGADAKVLLAGAHRYFNPGPRDEPFERTPAEFLEWLSGWVALTLRDDWNEEERRRMLARIVPSYRQRGTPDGLRQALVAFTGAAHSAAVSILEQPEHPFQIGVTSTIGKDAVLAEGRPHHFVVRALLPGSADLGRKRAALRAIIDLEKPAHTSYDLFIQIPTLQVGKTSTVGMNTSLGTPMEAPRTELKIESKET